MSAGTSTLRTTSASSSTAAARPSPNSLMVRSGPSTNARNSITMIAAAAVMVRPVTARPCMTARRLSPVWSHSSWMRLSRKTS